MSSPELLMNSLTYGPLSPIQTLDPSSVRALMAGVIPRREQRLVSRFWTGIAAAELRAKLAAIARAENERMLMLLFVLVFNGWICRKLVAGFDKVQESVSVVGKECGLK